VALTDDQFAKLKQAADDAGYHVGAFAYTIVTDWLAKH
jgi:hypothetical protein